ncbi:hypothetical protein I317_06692 [Kwoniella heveanensis CBS 569]|nr:hypothetical protein I317_06692 [Kwoniella heveanensis CBS 569]
MIQSPQLAVRVLYVLSALVILPYLATASAAAQFSLNPSWDVSNCFLECHQRIVATIQIPGTGHNQFQWITRNCENDDWKNLLAQCLPMTCSSAPDVAYAKEYAENFCRRAGFDEFEVDLPAEYLAGPNKVYFESREYLDSSSSTQSGKIPLWGTVVVAGASVIAMAKVL